MKSYIKLILLFLIAAMPAIALADVCTMQDNTVIDNCQEIAGAGGEQPNLLIKWTNATQREDNTAFPLSDLAYVRIYFNNVNSNNWTDTKVHVNTDEAIYVYKPTGDYKVRLTSIDTANRESQPSPDIFMSTVDPVILPPVVVAPKAPGGVSYEVTITVIQQLSGGLVQ